MQLFVNGVKRSVWPRFLWHDGRDYLLRLRGVDVLVTRDRGLEVYPLYKAVFRIETHPGQFIVQFFRGNRGYSLMLQEKYPYIILGRYPLTIETRELEDYDDSKV